MVFKVTCILPERNKKFDGRAVKRKQRDFCGTASMTPSSTTQNIEFFFYIILWPCSFSSPLSFIYFLKNKQKCFQHLHKMESAAANFFTHTCFFCASTSSSSPCLPYYTLDQNKREKYIDRIIKRNDHYLKRQLQIRVCYESLEI